MIVGLAPGLRGANRTGRPFTGDYAGDLLYATLTEFGFAQGSYEARPDDGLDAGRLPHHQCRALRAAGEQTDAAEITTCRDFLTATIKEMPKLRAIVALGRIAHETFVVGARRQAAPTYPFTHGGTHQIGGITLFDSYHCSRYNTKTRVLTPEMFRDVFAQVRKHLDAD